MTPLRITRFFPLITITLSWVLGAPLHAKEKAPAGTTTAATPDVELDRLVIQDSPPGSIPFAAPWRYSLLTGSLSYPPVIGFVGPKDKKLPMTFLDSRGRQLTGYFTWYIPAPDHIALKNGGQILAIDGIDLAGIDHHILKKLVFEGKAGEPVTLIIRGCGDEMHLFREITVRRISERKGKRIADEAAARELRPARSLADLPATPEPAP